MPDFSVWGVYPQDSLVVCPLVQQDPLYNLRCCVVLCCVVLCCVVLCCVVLCCVVLCCVVLCCVVLCCVVLCCVVLCCVVLCCVVLCGVVLCCVVLCCAVLCCVVPKALLPEGNGRDVYPRVQVNKRAVYVACALCASVLSLAGSGEKGRPGGHPPGDGCQPTSSHGIPSRSACLCRRSMCNTYAIVLFRPRRAFSNVARALAWAYQTLVDS